MAEEDLIMAGSQDRHADDAQIGGTVGPMNENETWMTFLEACHKSIGGFARNELAALARKVIHQLQRRPAARLYGDDFRYKTLWDEYCHELQDGPHDQLEGAWKLTIEPLVAEAINKVPHHVGVLLSVFAFDELAESFSSRSCNAVWADGLMLMLKAELDKQAAWRDINHLKPRWED